jgi:hypothetical protein
MPRVRGFAQAVPNWAFQKRLFGLADCYIGSVAVSWRYIPEYSLGSRFHRLSVLLRRRDLHQSK